MRTTKGASRTQNMRDRAFADGFGAAEIPEHADNDDGERPEECRGSRRSRAGARRER